MSDLLDLYNKSTSPHVADAKKIPGESVHFFDRENKVDNGGFKIDQQPLQTNFTDNAEQYYNTERKNIVIPQGMDPSTLDRYSPDAPYYNPGQPSQ